MVHYVPLLVAGFCKSGRCAAADCEYVSVFYQIRVRPSGEFGAERLKMGTYAIEKLDSQSPFSIELSGEFFVAVVIQIHRVGN